MQSIMHNQNDHTCYLCMMLHQDYTSKFFLEEHHAIYGHGKRNKSEQYGLKIKLCPEHHRTSKEAVHCNHEIALMVQKEAQRAFEQRFPELNFREIFGKNYITEEEREKTAQKIGMEPGFRFIEE